MIIGRNTRITKGDQYYDSWVYFLKHRFTTRVESSLNQSTVLYLYMLLLWMMTNGNHLPTNVLFRPVYLIDKWEENINNSSYNKFSLEFINLNSVWCEHKCFWLQLTKNWILIGNDCFMFFFICFRVVQHIQFVVIWRWCFRCYLWTVRNLHCNRIFSLANGEIVGRQREIEQVTESAGQRPDLHT